MNNNSNNNSSKNIYTITCAQIYFIDNYYIYISHITVNYCTVLILFIQVTYKSCIYILNVKIFKSSVSYTSHSVL